MIESEMTYFPPPGDWRKADPGEVGLDPDRLEAAVAFWWLNTDRGL